MLFNAFSVVFWLMGQELNKMPMRPMAFCAGGCGQRVITGRCPACHTKQSNAGRDSSASRGYDARWARVSRAFRTLHPICGMRADDSLDMVNSRCVQQGLTTPAECVDHVIPIRDGGEMFNESNLMSACLACNGWKERTIERPARRHA